MKRAKRSNKCSNCSGLGHYKTKCQNVTQPQPINKGGRPMSGDATAQSQQATANSTQLSHSLSTARTSPTPSTNTAKKTKAPPAAPKATTTRAATAAKVAATSTTTASKRAAAPKKTSTSQPTTSRGANKSKKTKSMTSLITSSQNVQSSQASCNLVKQNSQIRQVKINFLVAVNSVQTRLR